jgi:AbrB family looped-hinge helix DNA binding protein
MHFIKLSTKGRILIPAVLRAEMSLEPGSLVAMEVHDETLVLWPITAQFICGLRGIAQGKGLSVFRDQEHRKERH